MLSRLWYVVIAAVIGIALAAAFMAQSSINRAYDTRLDDQLRRDRLEVELWLRLDARNRLDALAPFAAHADVRSALRRASARRDRSELDRAIRGGLETKMVELNRQLDDAQADILIAVDKGGQIIGQLGGAPPPAGAALGRFPVVARALSGYVGDDVWVYNEKVYRIATRPVLDGGQYVGAVVHGMEIDDDLAARLAGRVPGATLTFFRGREEVVDVIATHTPNDVGTDAPSSQQITARAASALDDDQVKQGNVSSPLPVGEEQSGKAVFSMITGGAAYAGVAYGIGRPRRSLASPMDLLNKEDADALPWHWVIGIPLLLALLGMLIMWVERDRPLAAFFKASEGLQKQDFARFTSTDFRGKFRRIAENINEGVDLIAAGSGAPPTTKKAANLDEILGGVKEASASPYFGFGGGAAEEAAALPPVPAAPAPAAPAAPAPPVGRPAPPAMPAAPPARPAPPAGPPRAAVRPSQSPEEIERDHFREVFSQFYELKMKHGESTAALTYEKFEKTLIKTRDKVLQKHGAKSVRFTVYAKEGKAALKATPVKH